MKCVKYGLILIIAFVCCTRTSQYPVEIKTVDGIKVVSNPDYPKYDIQTFDLHEELSIGGIDAVDPYILNRPFDLKITDNGNLHVLDWGDTCIKVYDRDGQWLRTIGGPGQGPGELQTPAYFDISHDDHLYLLDMRNRRISLLDSHGNYLDGLRYEGTGQNIKVDDENSIYFEKYINVDRDNMSMGVFHRIEQKIRLLRTNISGEDSLEYGAFIEGQRRLKLTGELSVIIATVGSSPSTGWTVSKDGKMVIGDPTE